MTVRQLVESGAIREESYFYNENDSRIGFYGLCSEIPEEFLDCRVVEIYSDEYICVIFSDN